MPDLTDNQERLMAAVRDAGKRLTTERLGKVRDAKRNPLGIDAARKTMQRLADRDDPFVGGEGNGREREWWLTDSGLAVLNEVRPPRDPDDTAGFRPYVVLEEIDLATLVRTLVPALEHLEASSVDEQLAEIDEMVYRKVATVDARNTEHAFRIVAKDVYGGRSFEEEELVVPSVAVDGKRFKSVPVRVRNSQTVSVG